MKRRTFVAGMTALAGVSALQRGSAFADHINGGTPKYGGTLRVGFASDIHSGRFQLNRKGPPGYETFWVSNNTHNALVTLGPDYEIVPDLAKSWPGRASQKQQEAADRSGRESERSIAKCRRRCQ